MQPMLPNEGPFANNLLAAYGAADAVNKKKLEQAFPGLPELLKAWNKFPRDRILVADHTTMQPKVAEV